MVAPYPAPSTPGALPPAGIAINPAGALIQPQAPAAPSNMQGGNVDITSGIKSIAENIAAGFSRDPARRAQYQQQLQQENAQRQQELQQLRQQQLSYMDTMTNLAMNGGWTPGVQKMAAAAKDSMDHLMGDGTHATWMGINQAGADAYAAKLSNRDAQPTQFYNPATKESRSFNADDPADLAQARSLGFTSLGSPESSDVKSPEAMAQARELGTLSAPRTTIVNTGPQAVMKSDEELLTKGEDYAAQARGILPALDLAEQAAKAYKDTGVAGQTILDVKRFAKMMGADVNVAPGELLNSVQLTIAQAQRLPGSGSQSDREFAANNQAVPGLMNSQSGNIMLAKIGRRLIEHRLSEFERLKSYVRKTGSSADFQYDMKPVLSQDEFNMLAGVAMGGHDAQGAPPAQPPPGWSVVQ